MNKPTVLHTVLLCLSLVVVSCKETKTDAKHEHHEQAVEKADMALNDVYQCPMDCEDGKTYDKEGLCPVCKMDLQKVKKDGEESETDHAGHDHSDS